MNKNIDHAVECLMKQANNASVLAKMIPKLYDEGRVGVMIEIDDTEYGIKLGPVVTEEDLYLKPEKEVKKRANKMMPSGHKWKEKAVTYCANCGQHAGLSSDICSESVDLMVEEITEKAEDVPLLQNQAE